MSEQGNKGGFKFNATLDIGHVITFVMMLGALAVAYRGIGENKIATDMRITAVEKESRESREGIVKITDTLRVIGENQVRLSEKLDAQEKRIASDEDRLRHLERR